jgi:hypothetical protein
VTPEQKFKQMYKEMADLCEENGWGDPFSYARAKEIYAACKLGHTVAPTLSGADAINEKGQEVEYKSTIGPKAKGSYTGISVQPTWEQQVEYLKEEKILKYPEHYFNRFESGELVESYKMTGQQVYDTLLPKLRKSFVTVLSKKDPRLSANVTTAEIKKYGVKVL